LTCQLLKAEGLMLFFSGDHQGALKVNLEGVALAHSHGLAEPEIIMLHNCGDAYLVLEREREALYFYSESLRRARLARFDRLTETNELYLGFLEARHLGLETGLERIKAALENAERVNRVWNMTQGNLLLGRALLQRGELVKAREHLDEAVNLARKSGVRFFIVETQHWQEIAASRTPGTTES
jgi:tetratricopeptide (TPR) repeat protein